MSDIIKRLGNRIGYLAAWGQDHDGSFELMRDAKAEIERLLAALQEIADNAFDAESAAFAREVIRAPTPKRRKG